MLKNQSILNSWLLALLVGLSSWMCYQVHALSTVAAVSIQRLADHDNAILEAKQKIAQAEVEIIQMRLTLATMGARP